MTKNCVRMIFNCYAREQKNLEFTCKQYLCILQLIEKLRRHYLYLLRFDTYCSFLNDLLILAMERWSHLGQQRSYVLFSGGSRWHIYSVLQLRLPKQHVPLRRKFGTINIFFWEMVIRIELSLNLTDSYWQL